ncbi:MAG TPA: hypothetical protein VGH16_13935 [Candidatus Binatia bacterium]|jgi:hypothetical protein
MKAAAGLLLALLLIAGACSTHRGIKPIEPEVGHYSPIITANLTPTFRWEPLTEPDSRYDFAVFEVLDTGQASDAIYYREGLTTSEHTLQESLKPATNYYWSVRSRRGATVGEWATYDHTLFVPIPFGFYYQGKSSLLFPFKTPDK